MQTFKSKPGLFSIISALVLGLSPLLFAMVSGEKYLVAVLFSASILGFLACTLYCEKYVVDDNVLKIMYFNLVKTEMPLYSIKSVEEKPSLYYRWLFVVKNSDCLMIRTYDDGFEMVAPKDKSAFKAAIGF